jgi:rSAM/selenodomain-associated transferase 1
MGGERPFAEHGAGDELNELLVFAKAPRAGSVKTRLAETIGAEQACRAYRRLLSEVISRVTPIRNVTLCYSPADATDELRHFVPAHWTFRAQQGRDLGERLQNALALSFASGAKRVVVIGSDCPEICTGDIEKAWSELHVNDVVFGPATDGGYWLIGLNKVYPELFEDVAWGSASVLEQSVTRAKMLGLKIAMLRPLCDVDTEADWNAFLARRESRLQG